MHKKTKNRENKKKNYINTTPETKVKKKKKI